MVATDSGLLVGGTASLGVLDHALIGRLGAGGQWAWHRVIKQGLGTRLLTASALAVAKDEDVVVAGESGSTVSPSLWLARLDRFGHSDCESLGGCANKKLADCDDGKPCTLDGCEGAKGCTHQPHPCDDGKPCTKDTCDPKKGCVHGDGGCDDNNPCTADTCDPIHGCAHLGDVCDDGDKCTATACSPATKCPGSMFAGRCFEVIGQASSFNSARKHCQKDGRELASLRNKAENDFLVELAGKKCTGFYQKYVRIGLYTPTGTKDGYKWLDGTPITFTSFLAPPTKSIYSISFNEQQTAKFGLWHSSGVLLDLVNKAHCFACSGTPKVTCKHKAVSGCK